MSERPILFSAPMVRAILDGSKSQTRRPVKWQGPKGFPHFFDRAFTDNPAGVKRLCVPYHHPEDSDCVDGNPAHRHYCPYGDPGDRLWVKETWRTLAEADPLPPRLLTSAYRYWYEADTPHQPGHGKLRPSIFMPRLASRITLEITGVRVERLQGISEADAIAEGIDRVDNNFGNGPAYRDYRMVARPYDTAEWFSRPIRSYQTLWEQINGAGSWNANPWVWVVEFKVIQSATPKEAK